jgi:hypothetical protein
VVGDWYEIGMALGLGLAAGVFAAGLVGTWRAGWIVSTIGAAGIGVVAGLLVRAWLDTGAGPLPGAVVGAVVGALSAGVIVRGALRRGGTAGGTAFLLVSAAVVIALLALVPVVGYVMAVGVPVLALRRARSEPERYAGLRTLSK